MVQPPLRQSNRERFNVSRFAIKYPWPTLGFWIAIMVAGFLAFSSLKYALFPDITFPVVVVNATAPLTSAADTEAKLTLPMEQELKKLEDREGLTKIRSSTYPGRSIVSLSFEVGTKLKPSTETVEKALKQLKLPKGTAYEVKPINLNEAAVISYAISSPTQKLPELTRTAQEEIVPAIARVPGVLKVNLIGVPGEGVVKTNTPKGAAETVVLSPGTSAVRFNSQDVLAFEVVKQSDANTLEVVKQVEKAVEKLSQSSSEVKLTLAATQAEYINQATHSTIDALIEAIVLSVIVMYPFLWNWKATIISALAIPTTLFGTFIVMAVLGYNLETITLLALALVIGIIVDDAIVDVENIIRHLETGKPPRQAVIEATNEIGLTVTAATLTVVAVFLPVGLMEGVIGQFFRPFGITVSVAVIISLLVARTLSPMLGAYWLRAPRSQADKESPIFETQSSKTDSPDSIAENPDSLPADDGSFVDREEYHTGFVGWYRNLLEWSLDHRLIVIGLAIVSFVAGLVLIPFIPTGFIPKLDRGEFNIRYTAPLPILPNLVRLAKTAHLGGPPEANQRANLPNQGNGLTPPIQSSQTLPSLPKGLPAGISPTNLPPGVNPATLAAAKIPPINPLQDSLDVAKKLETSVRKHPAVESVFTSIGTRQQPNKGVLYIKLKKDRKARTAEVQDQIRKDLPVLKEVNTSVEDIQFVDTGGEKPLQVVLMGDNSQVLSKITKQIKRRMEKLPGFADITMNGVTDDKNKITQIERSEGQRIAYVSANLGKGIALGKATRQVEAIAREEIKKQNAGKLVTLERGSDSARVDEIFDSFKITLGLAVLCIMVVLVLLFKSLLDPLVVAISLPLSVVGALVPAFFTRTEFGMISIIGLILLMGLTNKSAILLVDYINQLRRAGFSRTDAILKAGPVRLRPILMTTASTILGMVPIALGLGAGAELRAPMAYTIIGGLVTSTLLSLIVIPVVYAVLDDFRQAIKFRTKKAG